MAVATDKLDEKLSCNFLLYQYQSQLELFSQKKQEKNLLLQSSVKWPIYRVAPTIHSSTDKESSQKTQ